MTEAGFRDEREQLAAEYALGVLDGEELTRARDLLREDSSFRLEVGRWLGRLAPLLDDTSQSEPPARVWAALERRIGGVSGANDNAPALRRQLNAWRAAAAGAAAIAASLGIVMVTRPVAVQPPPVESPVSAPAPMMAMLGDDERGTMMVATWHPATRSLVIGAASEIASEPGHSHELWVIPADGTPRSLGTMPAGPKMHAQLGEPLARQLQEGATLAVSVEPVGGSPTGAPTGPVVASGTLESA